MRLAILSAPACIALLTQRDQTNGFATLDELGEAMGIEPGAPWSAAEMRELAEALALDPRVAVQRPIDTDEPTRYRLARNGS